MSEANESKKVDLGGSEEQVFDPFEGLDEELEETAEAPESLGDEDAAEEMDAKPESKSEKKKSPTKQKSVPAKEPVNPLAQALDEAEEQEMQSIFQKCPVFSYAAATEDITNPKMTFEELRKEKCVDFPELEDEKRVSWMVQYGPVKKTIANPKKDAIHTVKAEIEESTQFLNGMKKEKDKNPVCKVTPNVIAQKKGTLTTSYRGEYSSFDEADASGKVITIFPDKNGRKHEMRKNIMGAFITPVEEETEGIAGFYPALPQIPSEMLLSIIGFFRTYVREPKNTFEALVNVYWDSLQQCFIAAPPKQLVTGASVETSIDPAFFDERYTLYMEIHSHNTMPAFFSCIDDNDEKATRLYVVIGNLQNVFPDIAVRFANGGKHMGIDPSLVFESIAENCTKTVSQEWLGAVDTDPKEKRHFRFFRSKGGC